MSIQHVITLDDSTFDAEVLHSDSPLPILVDFGAAWCGPCKALRPIVERLAESQAGRLRVAEVDIDEAPGVARRLGIRGAPTVVVFRGGKETGRQLGTTTRERLLALCGLPDPGRASRHDAIPLPPRSVLHRGS
jgi:thioredoxin 1